VCVRGHASRLRRCLLPRLQQFCLRLAARSHVQRGEAILGLEASAFARRELSILSRVSQYATRPAVDAADGAKARKEKRDIAEKLVLLLHPYLRPNRKNRLKDPSRDDPKIRVLAIVTDLVALVGDACEHVPFYCSLAAPGPYALTGAARHALMTLLQAAAARAGGRGGIAEPVRLFVEMNAQDGRRVGDVPDFDRILSAYEVLLDSARVMAMLREPSLAATLLPHQILFDMHSPEFGVRTAARNAVSVLLKCLAAVAAPLRDAAAVAATATDAASSALRTAVVVVGGDLRLSLQVRSFAIRSGFLSALADAAQYFTGFKHPLLYAGAALIRSVRHSACADVEWRCGSH
jgi:hypothetical protein